MLKKCMFEQGPESGPSADMQAGWQTDEDVLPVTGCDEHGGDDDVSVARVHPENQTSGLWFGNLRLDS